MNMELFSSSFPSPCLVSRVRAYFSTVLKPWVGNERNLNLYNSGAWSTHLYPN